MLGALLSLSWALKPGDDPYLILNASRNSTIFDLDSSWRRTLHLCRAANCPDELKITDAYCYLSDPTHKLTVDLDGTVPEFPCFDNLHGLPCPSHLPTRDVTSATVFNHSHDHFDWLLFLYDRLDCAGCGEFLELWEEASLTLRELVKVARLNATTDPVFVTPHNLTLPAIVRVWRAGGSLHLVPLTGPFASHADILSAFGARYGPRPKISGARDLDGAKGFVFQFTGAPGPEAPAQLGFIARQLGPAFRYSLGHPPPRCDAARGWPLYSLAVRRGSGPAASLVRYQECPWLGLLRSMLEPSFERLTRRNIAEFCGGLCLAVVDEAWGADAVRRFGDWTFRVHALPLGSEFAKRARAVHDDRVILNGPRAWRVPGYMTDREVRRALAALDVGSGEADALFAEMH
jgi:hypothetical protein